MKEQIKIFLIFFIFLLMLYIHYSIEHCLSLKKNKKPAHWSIFGIFIFRVCINVLTSATVQKVFVTVFM